MEFDLSQTLPIAGPTMVSDVLMMLAKERMTGVLSLRHHNAKADVAVRDGVVVGVTDSFRENRLGERLCYNGVLAPADLRAVNERIAETGERVAEAILALQLCPEQVLLTELEAQSRDRLARSVGWTEGELRFSPNLAEVAQRTVAQLDLVEGILRWFMRRPDVNAVKSWLKKHKSMPVHPTTVFEQGIAAYQRLAPLSPLPAIVRRDGVLLGQCVVELAKEGPAATAKYAPHLFALHVARMLAVGESADDDLLPMPDVHAPTSGDAPPEDSALAKCVRREWLRARGRTYYDVLDIEPSADADAIRAALEAYAKKFGPDDLTEAKLGAASGAAQDLWALMATMELTLTSSVRRAHYDKSLEGADEVEDEIVITDGDAEALFLQGKAFIADGNPEAAVTVLEETVAITPDEVEYQAFLGWAMFLAGKGADKDAGIEHLIKARERDPNAVRPSFFLGLCALERGNVQLAWKHLDEAMRRAPADPDINAALSALPADGTRLDIIEL